MMERRTPSVADVNCPSTSRSSDKEPVPENRTASPRGGVVLGSSDVVSETFHAQVRVALLVSLVCDEPLDTAFRIGARLVPHLSATGVAASDERHEENIRRCPAPNNILSCLPRVAPWCPSPKIKIPRKNKISRHNGPGVNFVFIHL